MNEYGKDELALWIGDTAFEISKAPLTYTREISESLSKEFLDRVKYP